MQSELGEKIQKRDLLLNLIDHLRADLENINTEIAKIEDREKFILQSIDNIPMTVRTWNCLKNKAGVETVQDLLNFSALELRSIKYLGKITYQEVVDILHENGLSLRQD